MSTEYNFYQMKKDINAEYDERIVYMVQFGDADELEQISEEPHDLIHELADSSVPIYNHDLLSLAAENLELGLDKSEFMAFDGSATPVNAIAANIFNALEAELWENHGAIDYFEHIAIAGARQSARAAYLRRYIVHWRIDWARDKNGFYFPHPAGDKPPCGAYPTVKRAESELRWLNAIDAIIENFPAMRAVYEAEYGKLVETS